MKKLALPSFFSPVARLASLAALAAAFAAAPSANAATVIPAACPPYTFVGRVTDASFVAFDNSRVAILSASSTNGTPLTQTKTFFREDTLNNYYLAIPVATSPIDGYALLGEEIVVDVTDHAGTVWRNRINPAIIGTPGEISVVNIVLADDADGDGIDDNLARQLLEDWENSDYWSSSATYDPTKDTDGDGVSDLAESLAGTNPFNPSDVLAILDYDASNCSIVFRSVAGHSYLVQESSNLSEWSDASFATDPAARSPTHEAFSASSSEKPGTTHTLYLFPTSSPAFFRLTPQ